MDRFLRIELLIGKEKRELLGRSSVTVIGLGAVGSYALEALARSGVGRISLVDFDTIKPSNINRQLLALSSTIGRKKVEVAALRVRDINPKAVVTPCEIFAAEDSIGDILTPRPDLVIDAIDSLNPKTQVLVGCYKRGIPVISSMGAALRTDPSAIQVADLMDTRGCPLAFHLRKRVRRQGVGRGITAVFSDEKPKICHPPAVLNREEGEFKRGRERGVLGSLPTITGIFGLRIAHYAIGFLTGENWDAPALRS